MATFEIKHRWRGTVLYAGEGESFSDVVKQAILRRADLRRAVLSGADLSDAVLSGADLRRADLSGADLSDAVLSGADLSDADLSGADLSDAVLRRADLSGADLRRAVLSGADLSDAVLSGADLSGAVLSGAVLSGADLSGADLSGADLSGADLRRADLSDADLSDADLSDADLSDADLSDADLDQPLPVVIEETAEQKEARRVASLERAAKRAARFRERHPDVPIVEQLDRKILEAVTSGGGSLDMSSWHSCATTHCRAGWAVTLAGDKGRELEERFGPHGAGVKIYLASTGRVPNFFASTHDALNDLRNRAAEQGDR